MWQSLRAVMGGLALLYASTVPAAAQVNVGIGISVPGVRIGINLPAYPQLVRVPDYPVYYAPGVASNFFFYDGMYWVYERDSWYGSAWYNGPWSEVAPDVVPVYLLRVPVRYFRNPPGYFQGWRRDAPPRWGDHWGPGWQDSHRGWDRWNRARAPLPAPLPAYQRKFPGDRYPQTEQQPALRGQNYRYQPREAVVRQHYQQGRDQGHEQGRAQDRRRDPGQGPGQGHGPGQGSDKGQGRGK